MFGAFGCISLFFFFGKEVVALATVVGAGRITDFGLELLRAIVRMAKRSGMDQALSPSRYIVSTQVKRMSTDKGTTTT